MSLKKQFLLILILLVVAFVTDAAASIAFGVCYVGWQEIERMGNPVVMVPGVGLGSFIYLSTPNGCKS
jgi:hypothetical protein